MPTKSDQLYAALEQTSSRVPYTVTRTPDGFRVELDLFTPDALWGSDEDKAREEEMKAFTITAAKAWVRELLEVNDWKPPHRSPLRLSPNPVRHLEPPSSRGSNRSNRQPRG